MPLRSLWTDKGASSVLVGARQSIIIEFPGSGFIIDGGGW